MKNLADKFLNDSDKEKIVNSVKEVEKITSGEIVPMVVSSSYHYPLSNVLGGFSIALILSVAVMFIMNNENMWTFLGIFMVLFIILHELVKHVFPLKRLFLSDKEIEEEVEEAAIKNFFLKGLYKTRDETGVLIFISVFERKVWILADRGINSKVGKDTWKEIVDLITLGIKNRKQSDAIVQAVKRVGDILKENFPVKHDDTDELDNLIIGE